MNRHLNKKIFRTTKPLIIKDFFKQLYFRVTPSYVEKSKNFAKAFLNRVYFLFSCAGHYPDLMFWIQYHHLIVVIIIANYL